MSQWYGRPPPPRSPRRGEAQIQWSPCFQVQLEVISSNVISSWHQPSLHLTLEAKHLCSEKRSHDPNPPSHWPPIFGSLTASWPHPGRSPVGSPSASTAGHPTGPTMPLDPSNLSSPLLGLGQELENTFLFPVTTNPHPQPLRPLYFLHINLPFSITAISTVTTPMGCSPSHPQGAERHCDLWVTRHLESRPPSTSLPQGSGVTPGSGLRATTQLPGPHQAEGRRASGF